MNNQFNDYFLDFIDTKTYKCKQNLPKKTQKRSCIVRFDKKAIEIIENL